MSTSAREGVALLVEMPAGDGDWTLSPGARSPRAGAPMLCVTLNELSVP
jgi:hypothetical protein